MKSVKIYKIFSASANKAYIGSTHQDLNVRLSKHKNSYKRFQRGLYGRMMSYDILENGDAVIELVEDLGECSPEHRKERERHHILNSIGCINKNLPTNIKCGLSHTDYMREYRKAFLKLK